MSSYQQTLKDQNWQSSFGEIFKEFSSCFFSIALTLLIGSGVGFFERICLARSSLETLQGVVQATCVLQVFQIGSISFANLTQTFVARHIGAKEEAAIGSSVWQMVWISLLSTIVLWPLSFLVDPIFFKGTEGREMARSYFDMLMPLNFLFPLGATFTSFFLAIGKRRLVIYSALVGGGAQMIFDLIFLLGPLALGVKGAAWAAIIGRLVFCLILFSLYMGDVYREKYRTNQWKIKWGTLSGYAKVCTSRALGRMCTFLVWGSTTYLFIAKGKDHLSILSIGSSLILFCSFFSESISQTMVLVISSYLGAKNYSKLWQIYRLGLLFIFVFCGILAIPFLFFPHFILSFFFLEMPNSFLSQQLELTTYWVWVWILCSNISMQLVAFLLAKRDMLFYMSVMFFTWFTSCLPVYLCFYHFQWSPSSFWLILIADQCLVSIIYIWRIYQFKLTGKNVSLSIEG